jgi:hypothetical protein
MIANAISARITTTRNNRKGRRGKIRLWGVRVSERSRLKAANAAAIKKYLKPGVIRDLG